MPVEDHAVHPKTSHISPLAGCNSSKRMESGFMLLTRKYFPDGSYILEKEWIPNAMSRGCRQIDYLTLPECRGCKQEKDLEYIERMRLLLYPDVGAHTK